MFIFRLSILDEVIENRSKMPASKRSLIILGENFAGKDTLVSQIKNEYPMADRREKQVGLKYSFLDIKDTDMEGRKKQFYRLTSL